MNTEVPTNITDTLNNILSNIRNRQTGQADESLQTMEPSSSNMCVEHERNPDAQVDMKSTTCPCCRDVRRARQVAGMRQRFANMQVGKRFAAYQWRDYVPVCEQAQVNKNILKVFADDFEATLERGTSGILLGNHGTGKNMLAALVCKTLAATGHTALHTTVSRLIRRVRQSWRSGATETEEEALARMVEPDLLVVDEVGVQAGSANEQHILTEVINDRYESMKPTLLISNLAFDELENLLGARIIDRFYEGGSFILHFGWESFRKRGRKDCVSDSAANDTLKNNELLESVKFHDEEQHLYENRKEIPDTGVI